MKTRFLTTLFAASLAGQLFAGGMRVGVESPAGNAEAMAQHAVMLLRVTACTSPERTSVTATAEGVLQGTRKSIPLKVTALSTTGLFAVSGEWPTEGAWEIKMVAHNPVYKDYAPSVLVPMARENAQLASAEHYVHAPTEAEVVKALSMRAN